MPNGVNILIVEDSANMREGLRDILIEEGYEISAANSLQEARKALKEKFYNLALIDLKLSDGSGMELLEEIENTSKETLVIILTGFASVDNAVAALNKGVFSYIQKPIDMEELKATIKKALHMQKLSVDNKVLLDQLSQFSLQDPLTELYNYRYFIDRLNSEFIRARRYVLPLSLVMIDIDFFKTINDVYGHPFGDSILKESAQCLSECARENDVVVRYGGEEFVILLPDTNKDGAFLFSRRLMDFMRERVFDPKGKRIKLKFSMGLASFPEDGVETAPQLIELADKALHEAKEAGGDKIIVSRGSHEKNADNMIGQDGGKSIAVVKDKISKMSARVEKALVESIYNFAKARQFQECGGGHSEGIIPIVLTIGERLRLSKAEIENLKHGAILHDLGKIGIPDKVLLKPKTLTSKEYQKIKKHPKIGADIIKSIRSLRAVVPIIRYHHERFDGLGYSEGLKGEQIPLGARIIAVIDTYQALVSDRPQRKAYGLKEALGIIKKGSGTQFDPKLVKVFLKIMNSKSGGKEPGHEK